MAQNALPFLSKLKNTHILNITLKRRRGKLQINKDMAVNERRAKTESIKDGGLKETETARIDECLRYTVDAEGLLGWNGHLPLPLSM